MKSIKVCEYSRSRSFHDDLILQDQASCERSQDQWSSGHDVLMRCSKKIWGFVCGRGLVSSYCKDGRSVVQISGQ